MWPRSILTYVFDLIPLTLIRFVSYEMRWYECEILLTDSFESISNTFAILLKNQYYSFKDSKIYHRFPGNFGTQDDIRGPT